MERIKLGGYKMGLFSKKNSTKLAKESNEINEEVIAKEVQEKEYVT